MVGELAPPASSTEVLSEGPTAQRMKAVICDRYGPPEALRFEDVERPRPRKDEVLVRVHATTVTAGDIRMRAFDVPRPMRPMA